MVMLEKSRAQGTEFWQTYATWSYRENGLCLFPPPSALQSQLVSLEQTCGLPYSLQTLQEQKEERVASCPFADKSQLPVSPGTLSCQGRLQAGRGRQTRQEGKGVPLKYSRGEKAVKGTKTELFFHLFIHSEKCVSTFCYVPGTVLDAGIQQRTRDSRVLLLKN